MQSLKNCAPTEHVCNSFSNMETAEQGLGKRCFFFDSCKEKDWVSSIWKAVLFPPFLFIPLWCVRLEISNRKEQVISEVSVLCAKREGTASTLWNSNKAHVSSKKLHRTTFCFFRATYPIDSLSRELQDTQKHATMCKLYQLNRGCNDFLCKRIEKLIHPERALTWYITWEQLIR